MDAGERKILFQMGDPSQAGRWASLDDAIMGGSSRSWIEVAGGVGVFTGVVSVENSGGGFASIRSTAEPRDLGGWSGVELQLRGDGKTYKLTLRTEPGLDGIGYQAVFRAELGWRVVRLPFSSFVPTFRGRRVEGAALLDPSRVTTFGLLISNRQTGRFRLEVRWLGAWKDLPQ